MINKKKKKKKKGNFWELGFGGICGRFDSFDFVRKFGDDSVEGDFSKERWRGGFAGEFRTSSWVFN